MSEVTGASKNDQSNPFVATMGQLSKLVGTNPISSLTLGLLFLVVLLVGVFVLSLIAGILDSALGSVVVLVLGIAFAVSIVFKFSAATFLLHSSSREGVKLTARQAFDQASKHKNYKTFVLTTLVNMLILVVGFILLVIPGFYLIGRLAFAPFIAFYEGLSWSDSLKKSWELSNGHWFEVMGALIASSIVLSDGLLGSVGNQSGIVGRYFDLKEHKAAAAQRETHWMNYLLVLLVVVVGGIYFLVFRQASKSTDSIFDDNKKFCLDGSYSSNCDDSTDDFYNSLRDYDSSPVN